MKVLLGQDASARVVCCWVVGNGVVVIYFSKSLEYEMCAKNRSWVQSLVGSLALEFCLVAGLQAGFTSDTLVMTPYGLKQIGVLKLGDRVICLAKDLSHDERAVKAYKESEAKAVVEVTTEDGVVICATPKQRFFVVDKWVTANKLVVGDMLLKQDRTNIKVIDVQQKKGVVRVCSISVEKQHNFLVTSNGVLVHDGVGRVASAAAVAELVDHAVAPVIANPA